MDTIYSSISIYGNAHAGPLRSPWGLLLVKIPMDPSEGGLDPG